jgi:hypothetical protein
MRYAALKLAALVVCWQMCVCMFVWFMTDKRAYTWMIDVRGWIVGGSLVFISNRFMRLMSGAERWAWVGLGGLWPGSLWNQAFVHCAMAQW